MLYTYPGYLWHGRTELTEVPGTGMNVLQNLQKIFVRRVIPGVNTPGTVLYVPYRTQPWIFVLLRVFATTRKHVRRQKPSQN